MENLQTTEEIARKLSFKGRNEVFEAVIAVIDSFVSIETAGAIAQDVTPDKRAHQCGRAEGLVDLKVFLLDIRSNADRKNAPDVE
jgi:hypothetical protein